MSADVHLDKIMQTLAGIPDPAIRQDVCRRLVDRTKADSAVPRVAAIRGQALAELWRELGTLQRVADEIGVTRSSVSSIIYRYQP